MRYGEGEGKDITYTLNPVHDLVIGDICRSQPVSEIFKD